MVLFLGFTGCIGFRGHGFRVYRAESWVPCYALLSLFGEVGLRAVGDSQSLGLRV